MQPPEPHSSTLNSARSAAADWLKGPVQAVKCAGFCAACLRIGSFSRGSRSDSPWGTHFNAKDPVQHGGGSWGK